MKIVYVLNDFLPQQVAGTEVYVCMLAKEMQQKDHDVTIVIPNFEKSFDETYVYENINVLKFAEPTKLSRALIVGEIVPDGVLSFAMVLKEMQPDIIHFHTVGGSNGVSIHHVREAKKGNAAITITFHLAGYSCKTNNLLFENKVPCNGFIDMMRCTKCVYADKGIGDFKRNVLYKLASAAFSLNYNTYKWNNTIGTAIGYPFIVGKLKADLLEMATIADKIVVLTRWYEKVLLLNDIPNNKLQYIGQGLVGGFTLKRSDAISKVIKLVFVGRINESKGLHLLLQAMGELPAEKISLDIYGPTHELDYANKWKSYADAYKNIQWLGVIEPKAILNTLANYHVLCLPSVICEMSPLVIQEAFAAGLPVVASNVYGNAEQITDGENGWLFKFNDVTDLKNKLQLLINDPFLIEKARQHIKPVKSFGIVADEHEKLYKEIIAFV